MRTVLIGAADLLPVLAKRLGHADKGRDLVSFSDRDSMAALEAVMKHRPAVVALERMFASTSRGTALINRIKADPSLASIELQVVAPDDPSARVVPRESRAEAGAAPLDRRGTRRAPRVRIRKGVDVLVDGNPASLIDLSTVGAQIVSLAILRPNQRVRVVLPDGRGGLRIPATIAWAAFELPPRRAPQYRAGVQFESADPAAVQAFCTANQSA